MTNYSIGGSSGTTGLSALTTPAAGDLMLIVDVDDTSTPPAGTGGSDKKVTMAALAAFGLTVASIGTQYVASLGNDSNDGLTWATAKLTVPAAINALPTISGGVQAGVVEVGGGAFASSSTITVADTQIPWIRGHGPGQSYDNAANEITSPVHATVLSYSGFSDALDVN